MSHNYVISADLGGTNIKYGAVDEKGTLLTSLVQPTEAEKGPIVIIKNISNTVREISADRALKGMELAGIGVATPGPLNSKKGIIYMAPNLPGWREVPLKRLLEDETELLVHVENDTNSAAVGEFWTGAGKGYENIIVLTLGTGIGGGIILNGKLYTGSMGTAGEVGHMVIETKGPPCSCGSQGCLEVLASATAVVKRTREKIEKGYSSLVTDLINGQLDKLTSLDVYRACTEGDSLAIKIMEETGRYLGIGISNLIKLFDPQIIILGGGMSESGDYLFTPLRDEVNKRICDFTGTEVPIVPAKLENNAGVIGISYLVFQDAGIFE
jgi:glucokinase